MLVLKGYPKGYNFEPELFWSVYGSAYTILGTGEPTSKWISGYNALLQSEGIGTPSQWFKFRGELMNHSFELERDEAFQPDLTILAFPLDGLEVGKLALFKLRMSDRWPDDIVENSGL
jgi:hypothetical protein